jgi:hypothetical protein
MYLLTIAGREQEGAYTVPDDDGDGYCNSSKH